ncbi:MAG TPA: ectonucleotide pyrophosphatase/phosphodiesterase [Anaerolineae bacterium]
MSHSLVLPKSLPKILCDLSILGLVLMVALSGCGGTASSAALISSTAPPAGRTMTPASAQTAPPPTQTSTPTRTLPDTPTPHMVESPTRAAVETPAVALTELEPVPRHSCPCGIEHVVIISIDGLRPDAMEQAETPILDTLRAAGAYTPRAQAVLPSVTLVNHASMLGGMSPEKHGIYWNVNDPDLGKINGPTLFSVAHAAGLHTAMVVGKPKFEHLVLPGSVDIYDYAGFTDGQVVNHALSLIETELPDLLFIHLPDVDSTGHTLGWMSRFQLITIGRTDGFVGDLIAALAAGDYLDQTLLIITSDHGGVDRRHGSDSPEEVTIPWLAVGPGIPAGVILESDIVGYDTAATASYALHLPIPDTWDGRPVLEIFGEVASEQ